MKDCPMDTAPITWRHIRILATASMGQVLGTTLATLVGIVIPLLQLVREKPLASWEQGALGCVSLIGITVGSMVIGRLSDRFGYLFFFRFCPLLAAAAALTAWRFEAFAVQAACLFAMGFGIGGGYSLDSNYVSETMPDKWKGFMVGAAKAFCSLGNICTAALCFWILKSAPDPQIWNSLWLIVAFTASAMFISRIPFAQSPEWLLERGKRTEAESAVRKLLGPGVTLPAAVKKSDSGQDQNSDEPERAFFTAANFPKIMLCGVPWACEGLGVYGIGIFLPQLLMALGLDRRLFGTAAAFSGIGRVTDSVGLTALVSLAILPGFILGLFLIRRYRPVSVQTMGFAACAAGIFLLLLSETLHLSVWLSLAGLMIFEIFLNAGPHLVTFVLPSAVYPVKDRGEGAGFAAACGKTGAVAAVFCIPILLEAGGMSLVLWVTFAVQIVGAWVTWHYRNAVSDFSK